jgi:hypothetical protein
VRGRLRHIGYRHRRDRMEATGEVPHSDLQQPDEQDQSTAKRVALHEGRTMTSDGPFAEAKEHLAGFYLIECESMELAAKVPDAAFNEVEVRPIFDMKGLEL